MSELPAIAWSSPTCLFIPFTSALDLSINGVSDISKYSTIFPYKIKSACDLSKARVVCSLFIFLKI